jgi:hypothetical protein
MLYFHTIFVILRDPYVVKANFVWDDRLLWNFNFQPSPQASSGNDCWLFIRETYVKPRLIYDNYRVNYIAFYGWSPRALTLRQEETIIFYITIFIQTMLYFSKAIPPHSKLFSLNRYPERKRVLLKTCELFKYIICLHGTAKSWLLPFTRRNYATVRRSTDSLRLCLSFYPLIDMLLRDNFCDDVWPQPWRFQLFTAILL